MAVATPSPFLARLERAISLPVLMKEMRSRMRGIRAPVLLFIATAITIGIGLLILGPQWEDANYGDVSTVGLHMAEMGHSLFVGLMIVEGILCALIAPALTAGAISIEREQQTLELLLLTRLSSANLVLGKLLSSLSFALIILLCGLPVGAISFLLGGVDPAQFIWSLAVIFSVIIIFGAIGIYCSARFSKTTTAVVMSYVICLAWLGLVPLGMKMMELFSEGNSDIFLQLGLTIGVMLTLALVPATILSVLLTLIVRTRVPRVVNLSLYGVSAIGICALLYLPNALDVLDPNMLMLGNPIAAMVMLLMDTTTSTFEGSSLPTSLAELLGKLFVPLTVLMQLAAAWVTTVLTIGEVQRLRR